MPTQKKDQPLTLPPITPKRFDAEEFLKTASKVQKILEEEEQQLIKEKLKNINENNHTFNFL